MGPRGLQESLLPASGLIHEVCRGSQSGEPKNPSLAPYSTPTYGERGQGICFFPDAEYHGPANRMISHSRALRAV